MNTHRLPHTFLTLGVCLLFLSSVSINQVFAQEPDGNAYNVTVSPPVTYTQVAPGQTTTVSLTVENDSNQPLLMTPKVIDFEPSDSGVGVDLQPDATFPYFPDDTKTDLKQTFTLQSGEKHRLNLVIEPPQNAVDREYHLSVLFMGVPQTYPEFSIGSQVNGAVGSNLIVFVSSQTQNRGHIQLKAIKAPTLVDSLTGIQFQILAENTGTQATPASGSARVLNWQHQTVAEYQMYPDMILANSIRSLRPSQPATSAAEPDVIPASESHFVYKPLFLIGPYSIEVTFNGQTNQEPSTVQVLALPFSLVLIAILGPIIYFVLNFLRKLPIAP